MLSGHPYIPYISDDILIVFLTALEDPSWNLYTALKRFFGGSAGAAGGVSSAICDMRHATCDMRLIA